jgi:hypothetical protein
MSLDRSPKPTAQPVPDPTVELEVQPVTTAASLAACAGVTLDVTLAAEVPMGADLFAGPRVKLELELEKDLRQDLEDLQQKRWARAQDAKEEQLRLAAYLEELFIDGLIAGLESLIGFLKKKIENLSSAPSGLRGWSNHQGELTYLKSLQESAQAKLNELRG